MRFAIAYKISKKGLKINFYCYCPLLRYESCELIVSTRPRLFKSKRYKISLAPKYKILIKLFQVLKLEVDGVNVELPPIEGIIILNIMR